MEYNQGGSVERMRAELIKSGAIKTPVGTVPPPASGVTTPPPVVPVGPTPTPGAPVVAAQPGAVVGQPAVPAPVVKPKTGDPVQGEAGPNGEPLFYVLHDGIESKMTVEEMAQDHSYKSHNTRVGQENADKRRDLDLRETQLLARETAIAASGAASFDALLNGTPGAASPAPAAVAPPVVVPPTPPQELAVENPAEYARLVKERDDAMVAHNNAMVQASVQAAVEPLTTQLAEATQAQVKAAEDAKNQADMKTRMDVKMADLMVRVPALDMNAVSGFLARSSHDDVERWNHPDGYELVWGKILRGEQPGGATPAVPVVPVPGYTPPPTVYPATPPVAPPPYAEPGAAGGNVAHAVPTGVNGAPLPNMTTPDAIAQAIKNKRATVGPTVYVPHPVAR